MDYIYNYQTMGRYKVCTRIVTRINITIDFHSSMNVIRAAEEAFNAMPAEVRDRFQNDPGRFLEFANDASNYDEAVKMGLAIKRPEKAAVGSEKGLPEPFDGLAAVRPGGADPSSSQV